MLSHNSVCCWQISTIPAFNPSLGPLLSSISTIPLPKLSFHSHPIFLLMFWTSRRYLTTDKWELLAQIPSMLKCIQLSTTPKILYHPPSCSSLPSSPLDSITFHWTLHNLRRLKSERIVKLKLFYNYLIFVTNITCNSTNIQFQFL